ncbi:MAG: hypothetical protein AABX31_01935 [Nanoarchaeota archaeon]
MSKEQEIAHDALVKRLENYLRRSGQYYIVQTNVPYYEGSITKGEIDILAINHDHFDFYEVKGSPERSSFQKAVDQLRVARLYFSQKGNDYIYTSHYEIEPLDAVVERLHRKMRHKKKER